VDAIVSVMQNAAEEAQVERLCPLPMRLGMVEGGERTLPKMITHCKGVVWTQTMSFFVGSCGIAGKKTPDGSWSEPWNPLTRT
jgi:hypothetical protein